MTTKTIKLLKNYLAELVKTAFSSYKLFKNGNPKLSAITLVDFVMQIYPNIWTAYLIYTTIRCSILTTRYRRAKTALIQHKIWQEAQLYSSTKVLGILVSQVMLTLLGLTTPLSIILVLSWGLLLASLSAFAHHKASSISVSRPF